MGDRIEFVKKALNALGLAYRHDWSQVDGRELLSELSEISSFLDEGKELPDFDEWLERNCIIRVGESDYTWIFT